MGQNVIRIRFHFDSAHRIWGHENKCNTLHGHSYIAELDCTAYQLDKLYRVIDFSVVKSIIGSWINNNWDHKMILADNDPILELIKFYGEAWFKDRFGALPFTLKTPPTAEALAGFLFTISSNILGAKDILVTKCRIHETPNCSATRYRNNKRSNHDSSARSGETDEYQGS